MKAFKKISAVFAAFILIVISAASAFAAELNINGASANVGDTVTYTLNLADVPSPVAGIQLSVYYDSEYLELDADKLSCAGFPGYLANTSVNGEVMMNATEGVEGYDFTEKTEIISLTFTVLKSGSTNITYYIYDLYDIYEYGPGDYLKTYTLTSDISVNGNPAVTDTAPILDPERQESASSGDFVNNEEGVGEISPEDATVPETEIENTLSDDDTSDGDVVGEFSWNTEESAADDGEKSDSSADFSTIIIIAVIVIALVIVAAVIIVFKLKKSGSTGKGTDKNIKS